MTFGISTRMVYSGISITYKNEDIEIESYGPFAVERYETTKKIKFIFISQKCFKYCNLSRFHINSFFIFFGVSYLSTAKGPILLLLL